MILSSQLLNNHSHIIEFIITHKVEILIGVGCSLIATYIYSLLKRLIRSKDVIKKWKAISDQKKDYIRENSKYDIYKYFKENPIYIQPYLSDTPTHASHEPVDIKEFLNMKKLCVFFIKKVFIRESIEKNNVFFLFGDSGTGKTAALIHLYVDYIKKLKAGKHIPQIHLISLREKDALTYIKSIPENDRKDTILLLDALDETPEVKNPEDYDPFLQQLKVLFKGFARVVITCRPQFFPNDVTQKIITKPGIETSSGWLECSLKYLAPFSNRQVRKYLNRTYPAPLSFRKRIKALRIVKKQPLIAIRPMVLSYIKDIVEKGKSINTTLDLYDTIVYSILNRDIYKTLGLEDDKGKIDQWWKASSLVAKYMYENQKLNVTDSELDRILPNDIEKQFKQRSLLTRTGNAFHFSHKSFYEYFMTYRFLQYPKEIKQVYGMDFALKIYKEAYQAWSKQKDTPFAVLKNTHPYTVAISLNRVGNALSDINHFSEAESYYQLAVELFRQLEEEKNYTYKDDIAMVLNNLAILHKNTNQLDKAEEEYNKALTIRRQLADKNPNDYLPRVADTLNNLAVLHRNTNQLQEAEEEYNEALTTYRQLADKSPDDHQPDVAMTLNNLAVLHYNTKRYKEAEKEYNEALTIRRQLTDKYPDAYLPDVAMTLNNLAILHRNTNQLDNAEKEYNEALTTYRQLADKYPDAYLPDVAMTLNNLANLHRKTNQLDKAEEEYNEALTIRRQLADKNPDAYLPYVATTLNNLANLHSDTNQLNKAEEEYNEALTIRRQLADKNPDAFLPDVAVTLFNLALLHLNRKEFSAAEAAALESLEKYSIMAEKSHAAFDGDVKDGEELLERIRKAKETDA